MSGASRADWPDAAAPPADLVEALRSAEHVLVQGHVRPDGDAVSATLGLGLALERLGKRVHLCLTDGVPERFAFLPEVDRLSRDPFAQAPYDLAVLCDVASYVRAGAPLREREVAPTLVNIDHHVTNSGFGDCNWVDPVSSSTAEMILRLVHLLDVPLDATLAEVLMTGIATDTGFLKYPAATPETVRAVATLIEAGVDHSTLHRRLFEDTPLGVQRLKGRALGRVVEELDGRLLWTWVSAADGRECGVEGALASLAVSPLNPVAGAEVVACFEDRGEAGTVVELRSRGEASVVELALDQGGGGHPRASGCSLACDVDEAKARILPALRALVESL